MNFDSFAAMLAMFETLHKQNVDFIYYHNMITGEHLLFINGHTYQKAKAVLPELCKAKHTPQYGVTYKLTISKTSGAPEKISEKMSDDISGQKQTAKAKPRKPRKRIS